MDPFARSFSRTMTLAADTSHLAEVRRFVEQAAADAGLLDERVFDVKVAVSEACANAVEHAGDAVESLTVDATLDTATLTFVVSDAGVFRPPVLHRRSARNLGLGLPLMVALMDEVRFTRGAAGGTVVSLSVQL